MFLALQDISAGVTPDSTAAIGQWAGVALGSGNSPRGIPYSTAVHDFIAGAGTALYFPPGANSGTEDTSITTSDIVIAPTACTPSMKIYSYSSASATFTLYSVTMSTDNDSTLSVGSMIASCNAGASSANSPTTCTVTASAAVSAGTVMTLSAPSPPSSNAAFFSAFSCY